PAIVSPDVWRQAQQKMSKPKPRRRTNSYLLTSRVFCSNCGSVMSGGTFRNGKSGTVQYYRCNTRYKPYKIGHCSVNRNFRVDTVNKTVVNWLIEILTDEKRLEQGLLAYQKEQAAHYEPLTDELNATREMTKKARKRLDKLLTAFLDDEETEEIFMDKKRDLQAEISRGETRIASLEQKLESVLLSPERIKTIKHLAAEAMVGAEMLADNPEAQRELITALDVQVFLNPLENRQIEVKAVCALGEETRITDKYL
ncbi:MAG TPA: zinc ribbon domain-containing protein, partial [Anaerolineae bacterium]|nr:zinc ribbon domain-containing protein [Anaerolineae bacterium]